MSASIAYFLTGLVLQQAAYLLAASFLALKFERKAAIDAFHLIVPLAIGVYSTWYLATILNLNLYIAIVLGAIFSCSCDVLIECLISHSQKIFKDIIILASIIFTAIVLSIFDFLNDYQVLSVLYGDFRKLTIISACFIFVFSTILLKHKDRYTRELMLGVEGRALAIGWQELSKYPSPLFIVAYFCCWSVVISFPLITNGATSPRFLRDIILSLIIARLVSPQNMLSLIVITFLVALIRVLIMFFFAGNASSTFVEIAFLLISTLACRWNPLSRKWGAFRV